MSTSPRRLPTVAEDPTWYRRAVFYEVLVQSYRDSDGDGVGDFRGLIDRLGYLKDLGVDALWIPPFFPSPGADGGYDISDYTGIDPRYGTMEDFAELVSTAHEMGLRIVVDMVMNHSSNAHPWFQASRTDPDGPYRDFYVWRDAPEEYLDARIIFIDTETSNWTFDEVRGQYFWHRFFSHQPDLNFENPAVREAMFDVVRFWCSTGVDGFRLDAIPYLYEEDGTICENLRPTHEFIASLRAMVDREFPGTLMVAEANQPPEEVQEYFGTDEAPECHMCFHFPIMPKIFIGLKEQNALGIREVIASTPPLPTGGQWGTFLRNHDELTLEMVTDEERAKMYAWYAPEPRMKANVGIRRRLSPLLEERRDLIELANLLLLSLPGSPFLYYGDEIGMGDDIHMPDRFGVRTPMQWDATAGAGFSEADPSTFHSALISSDTHNNTVINVADQDGDEDSLLNWTRRVLAVRRSLPVMGEGGILLDDNVPDQVLAFVRGPESAESAVLCVANMSDEPVTAHMTWPWPDATSAHDAISGATTSILSDAGGQPTVELHLAPRQMQWLLPNTRIAQ